MRPMLTLTAILLAGTAMAQTGTFGTSSGADGGASAAGSVGGDFGAGVRATDPLAETNDAEPGLLGTDAVADPDVDAGLETGSATGLDATGVITDITELPPGAGDPGLDAGLDAGLHVGVDDGLDAMDDGLSEDDVDDTAAFPVLTAPGDGEVGAQADGEPAVVEADGPVVVVPADEDGEDGPAAAVNNAAIRLTEGVDGDVQPKRVVVGAGE